MNNFFFFLNIKYPVRAQISHLILKFLLIVYSNQYPNKLQTSHLVYSLLNLMWATGFYSHLFCFPCNLFVEEANNLLLRDFRILDFADCVSMIIRLNLLFVFLHLTLLSVDNVFNIFPVYPKQKQHNVYDKTHKLWSPLHKYRYVNVYVRIYEEIWKQVATEDGSYLNGKGF